MRVAHINGAWNGIFWPHPLERVKRSNIIKFQLNSILKILYQTLCVLTNKRYTKYQTGFSFKHLGHAPGVGLWGARGAHGVKKKFEHGHVTYQNDGDDEQNRMQVKFSSYGQTGDLGVRPKGQIS